jgi:hypothetical protein
MADYVKRATFFEGQIVGAADLNLAVDAERDAVARHLRLQHSWGIVSGLELDGADRTTTSGQPYKEVSVAPGLAVDGTGRAIVVTESTRAPEELFDDSNIAIADPEARYPVFLIGRDAETRETSGPAGDCQTTAANRVEEVFEIAFGRVGSELDLDTQPVPDVSDGPGGAVGAGGTAWRILLGFVEWNATIRRFSDVVLEADGIGRRYAGVNASEVTGAGGGLVLRSTGRTTSGAPAMQLRAGEANTLEFGPQTATGIVTPVMTVDTSGNLTVTGKIVGALAGGVQVESGIASDGMLLPLPAGITQQQVDSGEVVVQSLVTPRLQTPAAFGPADLRFPHFYECRVDARRVRCRVRWISMAAVPPAPIDAPWVVDYVLMAFPGAPTTPQGGS